MENKAKILATLKKNDTALSAGQIATISGLDKKEVDKIMNALKKEGAIISLKPCYWKLA